MPKVTIVLPSFDPGDLFPAALSSILGQSFEDFELIAIDSSSTDGTLERLREVTDPRLRLMTLPGPCGAATPSNLGISLATGEYIALMDSDDVMHEDRLARQVAFLESHPEVDVVGSNFTIQSEAGSHLRELHTGDAQIKALMLMMNSSSLHKPTVMFRTAFQRAHHLFFPSRLTDKDNALWLAMMKAGGTFANLAEDLLTYNRHPGGNTSRHAQALEAGKTPLRAEALLALMPDLTAYEAEAIALAMEEGRALSIDQSMAGLLAMERASRISTCRYGADREAVLKVLAISYRRVRGTLEKSLERLQ